MKGLAILLLVGTVFSYAGAIIPLAIPMENCPEDHHTGNMEMNCGYLFHCPTLLSVNLAELSPLSVTGRSFLVYSFPKPKNLTREIYRPPKGALLKTPLLAV